MRSVPRFLLGPAGLLALLAACAGDPVAPAAAGPTPSAAPAPLLAPGEDARVIVDATDAAGNLTMVNEFAAGIYVQPDGVGASVASVTVRTVVPVGAGTGTSSSTGPCITSTVVGTQTTAGWTASVKKPGGCDKEIVVELSNRAAGRKALFSYLYVAGRTRIDHGAVR